MAAFTRGETLAKGNESDKVQKETLANPIRSTDWLARLPPTARQDATSAVLARFTLAGAILYYNPDSDFSRGYERRGGWMDKVKRDAARRDATRVRLPCKAASNSQRKTEKERERERGGRNRKGLVWKISTSYKSAVVGMKLEGKTATRWGLEVGGDVVGWRRRVVVVGGGGEKRVKERARGKKNDRQRDIGCGVAGGETMMEKEEEGEEEEEEEEEAAFEVEEGKQERVEGEGGGV